MQIEHLALDALIPYARNSRTHSDEQVAQVAASIREFGFTNPVLIDGEGGIIAGHGRVMAARKLGLADVPCIRLAHLTEAQKRAYIIADNKLALNAGWDEQMLALELRDLADIGFDTMLTGYSNDEIEKLVSAIGGVSGGANGYVDGAGIVYQEKFAVLVECSGEANQAEIYNKLTGLGLACKVLVN
jgi:ParB-like chromosome segregation protein Spo0J